MLARLRQRKIGQWALAYLAGAWLLLQLRDVLGENWAFIGSLGRGFDVALVVGLAVTLVLAWYHGEQGRQRVTPIELMILAVLLFVGGVGVRLVSVRGTETEANGATTRSAIRADSKADARGLPAIAVLPFENRSADANDAYFTDGVHDELLTALQRIGGLTVISRTSVDAYRDTEKTIPVIASELGVHYVLEGGVQRSGRQVRINLQLIEAATDDHLWSEIYDRELTPEALFEVQSEIVETVAARLRVTLTREERLRGARHTTSDPQALDLYMRAMGTPTYTRSGNEEGIRLLSEAVARDSDFLVAIAALSMYEGYVYQFFADKTPERAAAAKAAADRAVALDSTSVDAQLAMGLYLYRVESAMPEALDWLDRTAETLRGDETYLAYRGYAERRTGRWEEALASLKEAAVLNPWGTGTRSQIGLTLMYLRRYDEAEPWLRAALEDNPTNQTIQVLAAALPWLRDGDRTPMQEAVSRHDLPDYRVWYGWMIAMAEHDWASALAYAGELEEPYSFQYQWWPRELFEGFTLRDMGDRAAANDAFRRAAQVIETQLARTPDDPRVQAALAHALAGLGREAEAIAAAEHALDALPVERDAMDGPTNLHVMAVVHAHLGHPDEAVAWIDRLLSIPSNQSPAILRSDPLLRPLHEDERFLAVLEKHRGEVF